MGVRQGKGTCLPKLLYSKVATLDMHAAKHIIHDVWI